MDPGVKNSSGGDSKSNTNIYKMFSKVYQLINFNKGGKLIPISFII